MSVGEAAGSALVTAVLSNPSAATVTVTYATSNGTASAGSDYTTKSGTFSFAPGVMGQSTGITILNDAVTEPNETVTLTLSAPNNATLGSPNPATLTILDDETAPPPSETYETYDALGNLIKHGLTNYGYGATGAGTGAGPHQARTVGGQAYTYDAVGNLTSGGGRTYTWDSENRPSQIVSGAVTETYAYDADGERISRTSAGTTTVYLGGIWEETTAGAVKQYYSLHAATVAVRDSVTGVAYLHADHLGSVSVASGAGAALLSRQVFGPWGTVTSGGVSQTALNFTGQRLDSGTGLLYYHARYYDPVLARFVSADSVVPGAGALTVWPSDATAAPLFAQGPKDKDGKPTAPQNSQTLNRYTYVGNNPVSKADPSGHCGGSFADNLHSVFDGSCLGMAVAIWKNTDPLTNAHTLASAYIGLSAVALVYGALGAGKLALAGGAALLGTGGTGIAATAQSVNDKLQRYLLEPTHPDGGSKAKWFDQALGYTKANMEALAKQIVFDPSQAVPTIVTNYGQKYQQIISITGTNGRVIDVPFIWIRNLDGVVRLVTAIPPRR